MLFPVLALAVAAIFTGAAIYINAAEQPARLSLSSQAMLLQWRESYRRAIVMQAGLALFGGTLGLIGFYLARDWRLLAGALLLLANWPYTFLAIMPVNRRLNGLAPDAASAESDRWIGTWGRLHAVRSALGALALLLFATVLV